MFSFTDSLAGVRAETNFHSHVLQQCARSTNLRMGTAIHARLFKRPLLSSSLFLQNHLLNMYFKCGADPSLPLQVFEEMPHRNVVSWSAAIAGLVQCNLPDRALSMFCRMRRAGESPNEFSFSSILTGLAACSSLKSGEQVHAQLVKHGYGDDVCVGNSLVDLYQKNQDLVAALRVFDEMSHKNVISWTGMATGCLQSGQPLKALELVQKMKAWGIMPNKFTIATAVNACSSLASVEEGKKAHGFRIKLGSHVDACVDNALIDMYAKCGSIEEATRVFQTVENRSVITWTTMIMGFARNGLAKEALSAFDEMIERVEPNYITFVCVLHACSQGGLVDEGLKYFASMQPKHGISPGADHYACIIDLLGKAGRISEAEELILSMPVQPGLLVWQTLLGACRIHGDVETGKRAAEHVLAMDKKDPSTYILLSQLFSNSSNWDDVRRARELMENSQVQKIPGSSWIEGATGNLYAVLSQCRVHG